MLIDLLLNRGNVDFTQVVVYIVSTLTVIFLTLPIHEFAHAFAADRLGDPTARYAGRLTVNPLAHIDYLGALLILLVGFGWAKPVPVSMYRFKKPKLDMALTALAGPVSNLILAFVSLILLNVSILLNVGGILAGESTYGIYIALFFFYLAQINITLAVFNLIPIPPLDGSRVLNAILPDRIYYKIMQYERYIYFAMMALVLAGAFTVPLSAASNGIFSGFAALIDRFFPEDVRMIREIVFHF